MWTVQQAANELGYSEKYIRALCGQHRMHAFKTKGHSHEWMILSLEIQPATYKSRYHKDVVLRYLDKLEPLSALELQSIEIVRKMILGYRNGWGATSKLILNYLETHEEASPREIALECTVVPHNIRVTLSRLVNRGKVVRLSHGVYRRVESNS